VLFILVRRVLAANFVLLHYCFILDIEGLMLDLLIRFWNSSCLIVLECIETPLFFGDRLKVDFYADYFVKLGVSLGEAKLLLYRVVGAGVHSSSKETSSSICSPNP